MELLFWQQLGRYVRYTPLPLSEKKETGECSIWFHCVWAFHVTDMCKENKPLRCVLVYMYNVHALPVSFDFIVNDLLF